MTTDPQRDQGTRGQAIPPPAAEAPAPPPPPTGHGGHLLDGVVDVSRLPAPEGPAPGSVGRCGDRAPLAALDGVGSPLVFCHLLHGHAGGWHRDDRGCEWYDPTKPGRIEREAYERGRLAGRREAAEAIRDLSSANYHPASVVGEVLAGAARVAEGEPDGT